MPRIKIISKGLPKASAGLNFAMVTTTSTKNPMSALSFSFTKKDDEVPVDNPTAAQAPVANTALPVVSNPGAQQPAWKPLSGGNQLSGFIQNPIPNMWDNNSDISGINPNNAFLPQKTIVTGDGNKTTTSGINMGGPKLYSTDLNSKSAAAPAKPKCQ
jgi:hypothetical protein